MPSDHVGLHIDVSQGGRATCVILRGELDLASQGELQSVLDGLGADCANIEIDMRGVSFIDSSGLSMLTTIDRKCAGLGGQMVVRSPAAPVRRLLEISGLTSVLLVLD